MAYEVPVALITGSVGLTTGILGSLVAPWANWGVEKRRLRRQARVDRITEWRAGVADLRLAEEKNAPRSDRELKWQADGLPDFNVRFMSWFVTLEAELTRKTLRKIGDLREIRLIERKGQIPALLEKEEFKRIEREKWKLI
jgi:hypothetical protein